jgi:hypothetical protein
MNSHVVAIRAGGETAGGETWGACGWEPAGGEMTQVKFWRAKKSLSRESKSEPSNPVISELFSLALVVSETVKKYMKYEI